jgi:hypothetical protein
VRHAADNLTESGRIVVEDFAYESTDEKTLRWFGSAIRLLEATGSLTVSEEFLGAVLSKTETLKAWRQNHEANLHTAAAIDAQLENVFGRIMRDDAAYYFRYVANAINATERRNAILQSFAELEETLATDGSIVALGRRFVAERAG